MNHGSKRKKSKKGGWPAAPRGPMPAWASCPASGAYASFLDAFRVCGQGMFAYCRKGQGGEFAFLLATVSVLRGGLEQMVIGDSVPEEEFRREILEKSARAAGYLVGPAPPETVATILWGAYEFMCRQGYMLPPGDLGKLKAFVPQPFGSPKGCLNALTGPGGLVAPRLLDLAVELGTDAELPEGKEQMVITTARFRADDADALLAWMRASEPDLTEVGREEDGAHFNWTRAYPKGHWSPFARERGARQELGDVVVSGDALRIETKVASAAARFAQLLHEQYPGRVRLEGVEWKSWKEWLHWNDREEQ